MRFEFKNEEFTIKQLMQFNKAGKLNLSPGFQRQSVWSIKQQQQLVESLLLGMPVPTMFFWERKEGRKVVYDVIDGKQRLEAVIAFLRVRKPIAVKIDPDGDADWGYEDVYQWSAKDVKWEAKRKWRAFEGYKVPVVLVSGTLADIEQLFIRINSTGSKLTKAEILHAKWNRNSNLLKVADVLAKEKSDYFQDLGILSRGQISRMKAVELVAELLLSMEFGAVLNKKQALDGVMSNTAIHQATLSKLSKELKSIFKYIEKYFPQIRTTRFRKTPDFYALTFCLWKMKRDGYVLESKRSAEIGFSLLTKLSVDIARSRDAYERGESRRLRSPAQEYHTTVVSGSDSYSHRKQRVEIISSLLEAVFASRDVKRAFSDNQKQLLWHSAKDRICSHCKKPIHGWNDVDVDHIISFARGGATSLSNGQLLHSRCNKVLGKKGK